MTKKTVYLETSIVSYLTARPSGDLLAAAGQKATIDWWDLRRRRFDLYVSDVVLEEAGRGNPEAAKRRLAVLTDIPVLTLNDAVVALAKVLIGEGALPAKAVDDAMHVAISAVHGMDFLLTWNCRHIDNAETKPIIRSLCMASGHGYPEICTPQELMGVFQDE